MTFDFIDALEEACDKEGVAFLVLIQAKDGQRATMRVNLDNWVNSGGDWSKEEDVIDAIMACFEKENDD